LRSLKADSMGIFSKMMNILNGIVIAEEILVNHYEPESKDHSLEWKYQSFPTKKKFNTQGDLGDSRKLRKKILIISGTCMDFY